MLYLSEHKKYPDCLSDLLPWACVVSPGVLLNKDGSFQATFKFRGPDLDSATTEELVSLCARVNHVLKRFGSGWAFYFDAIRRKSSDYSQSSFPEAVSYLIDEERKALFQGQVHYESLFYMTLIFLPPTDSQHWLSQIFLKGERQESDYRKMLEFFELEVAKVFNQFQSTFPELSQLSDDETLTYLHSLISEKHHPVQTPEIPMYIDAFITDTDLVGGLEPALGRQHIRAISVRSFPGRSYPGLLDKLNRLGFDYRWSTRFICLDKRDAEVEAKKLKKRWFAKRTNPLLMLQETITGQRSVMQDSFSTAMASDAEEVLHELAQDSVAMGYFTGCIILMDSDPAVLETKLQEVDRVVNGQGLVTKLESTNTLDAWLGTIPGNCRNNKRRPKFTTGNLAHIAPLSAIWVGPERNEHLSGPPLFEALTNGSSKFRFVHHVGDVGHMMCIGPTGAGKSTFTNFCAAQFLRYPNAKVFIFDNGGSARALTRGVGGEFSDFGNSVEKLAFQPLRRINEPDQMRWALHWVLDIAIQEGASISPAKKESLWSALENLSTAPAEQRTLFGLLVLLQDEELRSALKQFTVEGAYGYLLDNKKDNLNIGRWHCFEMEALLREKAVIMPVLSYLFHRIEEQFRGAPTLLILDEAWLFFDHPAFAAKLREWLKVLRKKNVSVLFASQSLDDIERSSIAQTVREACHTRIFLPNPTARTPKSKPFYEAFGLNDTQIRIVSESIPKQHYYYQSRLGNRLFDLTLGPLALAYCAATSIEEQGNVERLRSKCESLQQFNARYLEAKKITWAVEALGEINQLEKVA